MTPDEIEALKRNWLSDPCWDIEETDGFEAHKPELLAFRLKAESVWRARRVRELSDRAAALGVPGNTALVEFIERLENKIFRLQEVVEALEIAAALAARGETR